MPGYNKAYSTYFRVVDLGFNVSRLFDLPHDLCGEPGGAIKRLSSDGIISKTGYKWIGSGRRAIWGHGPRWPVFRDWCERRGKI